MSPAQRTEVALHPVTFLRRLGQVEIAGVFQVRTLVEVSFKGAAQKAHVILLQFRLVAFLDEPVLLMHDAEVRQHLDSLAPAAYLVLEKLYRFITLSYLSLTLSGIECFSPAMPLHFGSKIGTSSLSTFFFR